MTESEARELAGEVREERGYVVDVEFDGSRWVLTVHTSVGQWTAWEVEDWPWLRSLIIRAEGQSPESFASPDGC